MSDDAYDKIDRFLRNNLDDADYADYSFAIDSLAERVLTPASGDALEFASAVLALAGIPAAPVVPTEQSTADWLEDMGVNPAVASMIGGTVDAPEPAPADDVRAALSMLYAECVAADFDPNGAAMQAARRALSAQQEGK